MFREHTEHGQNSLFGLPQQLSETRLKRLKNSMEATFYQLVFCKIPEEDFAVLYSDKGSRPNTPVNVLVAAEILKHAHGWTDEELMDDVRFNIKTRWALGMDELSEDPFCERTLNYFRKKLETYERETGVNLLERVFDHLTDDQLEVLNVKTGLQRMDSYQAMSNIRRCSRLELVIEVLQRLWRVMDEDDRNEWDERMKPWIEDDSDTLLYRMKPSEYETNLKALGGLYRDCYEVLKDTYGETRAFQAFERVYRDQFVVVEDKINVRDDDDLESDSLQSPDDPDATYRNKKGEGYRGQAVHVKETCAPNNPLQLINDVFVTPNNVDDSKGLKQRLKQRPERYEDIDELFVDGGYGSEDNDHLLNDMGIDMVQTGIRGRPPDVRLKITPIDDQTYEVSCPNQTVCAQPTRKRHKAVFDPSVCNECSLASVCPTQVQKQGRVYYFDEAQAQRSRRLNRLEKLPKEKQTLRNNVEATVKEFTVGFNHKGKLRTRGSFKTKMHAICTGIGINLGRIHRYLVKQKPTDGILEGLRGLIGDRGLLWTRLLKWGQKLASYPFTVKYFI